MSRWYPTIFHPLVRKQFNRRLQRRSYKLRRRTVVYSSVYSKWIFLRSNTKKEKIKLQLVHQLTRSHSRLFSQMLRLSKIFLTLLSQQWSISLVQREAIVASWLLLLPSSCRITTVIVSTNGMKSRCHQKGVSTQSNSMNKSRSRTVAPVDSMVTGIVIICAMVLFARIAAIATTTSLKLLLLVWSGIHDSV